ncbi:DUF3789 domain-containing protein [Enterococcus hirae]|nr:DUF3789 domain-containing protein [Enterococcus hirae]EMF0421765.1 DUF3789 domain-containing protein [Enterococcus hirae]EMF0527824.1 DUF3789 domain-containing protein [Enterococcus hirae]RXA88187.1 DUF3789 domain-containing protein [Enterococcus hirae]
MLFIGGLFVGAVLGISVMSLLISGKQEDEYFGRNQ